MRVVLLQTCRDPQAFRFICAGKGHDLHHLRGGVGQRAGLVKDDRIRLGGSFQELSSLDGDIALAGLPDRGEHGERHGQVQRA